VNVLNFVCWYKLCFVALSLRKARIIYIKLLDNVKLILALRVLPLIVISYHVCRHTPARHITDVPLVHLSH